VDPEAARVIDQHEMRRREQLVWLAKRLDDQGRLRGGMPQRHAVDILWMITSFRSFDHLYTRSKLSGRSAAAILSEIATQSLFASAASGAGVSLASALLPES
jgi:hypothetical protein